MKKFSKLRHPIVLIFLLLTLQSCTCFGISLDKFLGRSNTNTNSGGAGDGLSTGMNCSDVRLTSPRDGFPNGSTTVSWDPLAGAVNYRVNIYSGGVRVGTWEAASPATSLQADVSQSAIGGGNPFEVELLAFDANGNYCRDYVTQNREDAAPDAVEESAPATEPPAPSTSILDGGVSYCVSSRDYYYANLPLNDSADPAVIQTEFDNGNLTVQIGDGLASCTVDASNRLLTCTFPVTTQFPTTIIVTHNDSVTDTVPFDGYACLGAQPGGEEEPLPQPPPPPSD